MMNIIINVTMMCYCCVYHHLFAFWNSKNASIFNFKIFSSMTVNLVGTWGGGEATLNNTIIQDVRKTTKCLSKNQLD